MLSGRSSNVDSLSTIPVQLRRTADAARVEGAEPGEVAAEVAARAAEGERGAPSDEERALLVEVRLESGEIQRRRIDLDLTEVGIERRVEREIRRDAVLEVAARAHLAFARSCETGRPGAAYLNWPRVTAYGSSSSVCGRFWISSPVRCPKNGGPPASLARQNDHMSRSFSRSVVAP